MSIYPERVLTHQWFKAASTDGPEQPLLFSLQAPWQAAKMVEMSHKRPLAMDSTFATNKYGVMF
jgi:hypothetical protein